MTFIKDLAARLNGAAESKADNVSLNGGDPTEWHRGGALTEEVRVAGAARQVIHDTGRSQERASTRLAPADQWGRITQLLERSLANGAAATGEGLSILKVSHQATILT